MSRVIVFGLDNLSVGEFTLTCDRGYMVYGTSATAGGGSTKLTLTREMMRTGLFQPGRMVLVLDDALPPWSGVIDPPISLTAPMQVTVYNAPYLLSMRCPPFGGGAQYTGRVADIADKILGKANEQGEMYLRLGEAGGSQIQRAETLDGRSLWEQLNAMVLRSGSEMLFRPKREPSDGNRLYTYVDVLARAGYDTDFLLHEGAGGNVRIRSATVERQIWNRVIGINSASSAAERLVSAPQVDETSVSAFRLRSVTQQFNTKILSALNSYAEEYLREYRSPILRFEISILDVRDTFAHIAPGNGVILHAPRVVLQDGREGWRGTGRIMAMAYNERENTIGAILEARYEL